MANHLKELYRHRSVPELASSRSLFALAQAMIAAVWAILFSESGLSDSKISFLKVIVAVTVLGLSLILPRYLERLDESRIYPLSLMISGISLITVAFYKNLAVVILAFALAQILYVVRQSSFSILFRDSFRRFNVYTLAQGMLGSMVCTAWFIGPILSGLIMEDFGPRRVMLFAGLIFILSGLIASYKAVSHKTKRLKSSPSPIANVKGFLKIGGIRSAYLIKSGIDAWWTLCFTFIPLIMVEAGYSLYAIGLFLGLSQLPLIFGEFLSVKQVSKKSFKKIFTASYLSLAVAMAVSLMVGFGNLVLLILVLCSIPLAFLEPISEIYFYHITRKDEEELAYPIYMTASTFGEGFLSFLILPVAGFLGLKFSFLAVALYMLALSLISSRLKR